jgi:DNA-binding protein HU-beta
MPTDEVKPEHVIDAVPVSETPQTMTTAQAKAAAKTLPTVDQLRAGLKANRMHGWSAARDAWERETKIAKVLGDTFSTPIGEWCAGPEYRALRDDRSNTTESEGGKKVKRSTTREREPKPQVSGAIVLPLRGTRHAEVIEGVKLSGVKTEGDDWVVIPKDKAQAVADKLVEAAKDSDAEFPRRLMMATYVSMRQAVSSLKGESNPAARLASALNAATGVTWQVVMRPDASLAWSVSKDGKVVVDTGTQTQAADAVGVKRTAPAKKAPSKKAPAAKKAAPAKKATTKKAAPTKKAAAARTASGKRQSKSGPVSKASQTRRTSKKVA